MKATTEDKVFKSAALLSLFCVMFIRSNEVKLWVIIPLMLVALTISIRKFLRAKKEGKPLTRYYIALGFIIISVIIFRAVYWYISKK